MNRRTLLLASVMTLPALPVLAQSSSGLLNLFSTTGAGANAFVEQATMANTFGIESSRILLAGSTHAQIREYAERMIAEHTAMSNELRAMPDAATRLPSGLDDRLQAKLIELRRYQGDELDRWYVQMEVESHRQALEFYEAYAANGEVPNLKSFAERNVGKVRMRLQQAQAFQVPRAQ